MRNEPRTGEAASPLPGTAGRKDGASFGGAFGSLSLRLTILLVAAVTLVLSAAGAANIRLHRRHLETAALSSAGRISDVIKRSTSWHMLHNDREGLYQIIHTIGAEPGIARIRIFNEEGRVTFSTDAGEVGEHVDKRAEACYACHAAARPLARLDRPDRFRIYRLASGERALGIINPIENLPACSESACHAHPATKEILGVLDTNLSLASADAGLRESTRAMAVHLVLAIAALSLVTGAVVYRLVHRPVTRLRSATERLTRGELGFQIGGTSKDEMGKLAASFDAMSRELHAAREESAGWARALEERVEQKATELESAHRHVVQVEKMASIGRLAAAVAHEINNPLSGIITYARLLRRWIEGGPLAETKRAEAIDALRLVETESRRCGEIVRNLLTFARVSPVNLEWTDIHLIVERCLRLIRHRLDLASVHTQVVIEEGMPKLRCDPAQMEQVLLALMMNAVEAMPKGGRLVLRASASPEVREARIEVNDNGEGIAPEILPSLFEPFFTTKESGSGVGLGLAISRGIVERHGGKIDVRSDSEHGTTFTVSVPLSANEPAEKPRPAAAA